MNRGNSGAERQQQQAEFVWFKLWHGHNRGEQFCHKFHLKMKGRILSFSSYTVLSIEGNKINKKKIT